MRHVACLELTVPTFQTDIVLQKRQAASDSAINIRDDLKRKGVGIRPFLAQKANKQVSDAKSPAACIR